MNVWYHTKAISNILSLNNARYDNIIIYNYNNGFRFTMSNKIPGGHDMISTENNGEIYYNYKRNTEGVSMLINVEEIRKHYTQRQYECEIIAREIYQMVVHP